ncbi:MAG: polysaccharide export protein [Acidobacteria bacterium]|nr:polysaccharide export protein [Acidobacteriota bacterium]
MYAASRRGILILVAGAVLLCPQTVPALQDAQNQAGAPAARPDPLYVIQPNDVLEVFVWKEPELSRKVLVRPDGRISFPLVQDLQASGISPGELKEKIEEQLKSFLTAPNVTIIVEAILSYRVFVVGKVQKPGALVVEKPVSVLQAIALAGGFADYAKESEITVVRNFEGETLVFNFNYKDVIKGRNADQNIYLRNGDVVVIP